MGLQGRSWQEDCSLSLWELLSFEQLASGEEVTAAIYSFGKKKNKEGRERTKEPGSKLKMKDFAEPLMNNIEADGR